MVPVGGGKCKGEDRARTGLEKGISRNPREQTKAEAQVPKGRASEVAAQAMKVLAEG